MIKIEMENMLNIINSNCLGKYIILSAVIKSRNMLNLTYRFFFLNLIFVHMNIFRIES